MSHWPVDTRVFQGVKVLLNDFVRVNETDTVVITYTPDSREPAAWVALELQQRGFTPAIVAMNPMVDDTFADRLAGSLPAPAELPGQLVVIALELDTMSHFEVFQSIMKRYGEDRCRVFRIISACADLFTKAFNHTPDELSALNATLLHQLKPARRLRVTSEGGTDIEVEIDSERYQWISNRGMWRAGGYTMLPAGEIATYPVDVNGVLVADGAFNANIITTMDVRLSEHPVRVEIAHGKAVSMSCADPAVQKMLDLCLQTPYARHVGEFGLGTNPGIGDFIAYNSHINERRCGLHLGFGQHNQSLTRVSYVADVHLDLITRGALVWVEDNPVPIDLTKVVPTSVAHPVDVLDEDITTDCCGIGLGQLRSLACPVPM
jgi:leucyl aminopeptidase (aminopeptidase T)